MTEGYVLVAMNDAHYVEMAVSAACSLRVNDDRPIALLIGGGVSVPHQYHRLFDHIVAFDPKTPFDGDFIRRFTLEHYTPFEKAMHVDTDCFLIGEEIDKFWAKFSGLPIGVQARLHTCGKLYRRIIVDDIIRHGVANGVYATNWGIFYYENTGDNPVMKECRTLFRSHIESRLPTAVTYRGNAPYRDNPGEFTDEPLWGIATARLEIELPRTTPHDALQITSPNTSDHCFDFAGRRFSAKKGNNANARGQFFHFAGRKPLDKFLEGTAFFRSSCGFDPPAIKLSSGEIVRGKDWASSLGSYIDELYLDGKIRFRFTHECPSSY